MAPTSTRPSRWVRVPGPESEHDSPPVLPGLARRYTHCAKRRQETTRAGTLGNRQGVGAVTCGNEGNVQFLGYMLTILGAALVLVAIAYVLG